MPASSRFTGRAEDVECRGDNAVGVESVVAVYLVKRSDLPVPTDAEGDVVHSIDAGQERQRMRMAIELGTPIMPPRHGWASTASPRSPAFGHRLRRPLALTVNRTHRTRTASPIAQGNS